MKRLIAVVIMLFVGVPLYAGDMVHLKSKAGDVTFEHKAHGEITECKTCHGSGTPGKIDLGGMELAHRLCGGCHTEKKMGPQANKCMECHKRSK